MGVVAATVERSRARGYVESPLHRARDVQEERPQCYTPAGNHHGGVYGVRTDPRLVVQHQGRATQRHRIRQQAQHEQQRPRLAARVLVPVRRDRRSLATGRAQPRPLAGRARDVARSIYSLALKDHR